MNNNDIKNTNDYELLMLYEENNEDAKNILYVKYKFIIDILIKKYKKYFEDLNIDLQEVYSECYVGFSDSLNNYKDNKNASLPTFITLCVERKLRSIVRKYNQEKYKVLQETYSLDFLYDGEVSLMDVLKDDKSDPLKAITDKESYNDLFNNITSILTKKEYDVFILMIQGLSYQEIAKILNKTPKQIDNAMQRIKIKVRNLITKSEVLV